MIWGLYGDYMGLIWGLYGDCMGIIRGLYGDEMEILWDLSGNSLGTGRSSWDFSWERVVHIFGLWEKIQQPN